MNKNQIQSITDKQKKLQQTEEEIKKLKLLDQKLNKVGEMFDQLKALTKLNQLK